MPQVNGEALPERFRRKQPPRLPEVSARYAAQFPQVNTFTIHDVFGDWRQAQAKFFADGAIFDQIGPGH